MAGPYNFQAQPKFLRNLVLSPNAQSAWQAGLAAQYLTQRQRFDGAAIFEANTSRRTDQGYAGRGTSFATDGQVTMWDTKLSGFKAELDPWLAAYMCAFLMGIDTITGAGPYTHTFTFDETTRIPVETSVYMEDTEAVKYTCPDMCVNDATFSISEMGAISAEMTMVGTGRQSMGGFGGSLPALPTSTYLLGSDASLTMNAGSFVGRHMSTTLKLDNQLSVHKAPGGGLFGMFVRKGNPKFSISTVVAAKDTDDTYTLFENDTAVDFVLAVNSGASAQMTVTIPTMHFKSTKLGFDKDMVVWQIDADETSCYGGGSAAITIAVVNAVATAFLVPA